MSLTKRILLWLLGVVMIGAGVPHFVSPEFYQPMMPPYLPAHDFLIWLSGVAEIALGAAVLIPRFRVLAAWGLIALFIAIFPANIHVALNNIPLGEMSDGGIINWIRLPFQFLLIAWAYMFTRAENA